MNSAEKITPFKANAIEFIRKRQQELSISLAEIERRAEVPKDTVVKMLKGAGTDYENYVAVMNTLRYSVPLYGKLISGVGVETVASHEAVTYIKLPEIIEYSSDLLAIEVSDEKYEPRYFKGTLLFFKQTSQTKIDNLNSKHPYVIKIKDKNPDLMLVREGSSEGHYTLIAIDGTAKITHDAVLEWCAKIEGTKWEY